MSTACPSPRSYETMLSMSSRLLAPGVVERRRRRERISVEALLSYRITVYSLSSCSHGGGRGGEGG